MVFRETEDFAHFDWMDAKKRKLTCKTSTNCEGVKNYSRSIASDEALSSIGV